MDGQLNRDNEFPFYLKAHCSKGVEVKHVMGLEKYVEVFQVTVYEKLIPFAVINLDRFNDEEVNWLIADLKGNRLLELDFPGTSLGLIFSEPDFVSDSLVEVPGRGEDVFYKYSLCLGDDMVILDIRDTVTEDGTPVIDLECRRMTLYLPFEITAEGEAVDQVDGELESREKPAIVHKSFPLTM